MFNKIKTTYREFPETFWVLAFSSFIDNIGNFMLMPFISIYIIGTFGISMVEMGVIYIIVGIGNLIGGIIGGSIADKFGRKKSALFGLLISGLFSISFIFTKSITFIYVIVGLMGVLGSIGGPARQAMLADILPASQRAEGFGILRVVMNLSATIGPALGGLLALYNFKWIFLGDAITSFFTAIIFIIKVPETMPKKAILDETDESSIKSIQMPKEKMGGYKDVFADWRFMLFVLVSCFMSLAYLQMNTTLPIFLTEDLNFSTQIYGLLISMNALMVVIFQFWITRKIKAYQGLIMMAIGNVLYGIGFGMYGFIATIPLAFLAMVIITIGEMIVSPFSQAIAANLAPEDKRGRYMAVFGWSYLIPMLFGVIAFGAIMDNLNRNIVWYLSGSLAIVAAIGYTILKFITKPKGNKEGSIQNSSEESQLGLVLEKSEEISFETTI